MQPENAIGKTLLNWRLKSNHGQSLLAESLSISQSAYSQLEHGKRALTLYEAYQLCKFYNKRMFELFPDHQVEIHESELFWVQKHEKSYSLSTFSSEKRILEQQNKELEGLLHKTHSLYSSLTKVFEILNKKS